MKKIDRMSIMMLENSVYGNGVSEIDKLKEKLNNVKMQLDKYSLEEVSNLQSVISQFKKAKEYISLISEKNLLVSDIKSCKSKNPDDQCRHCTCWKHTRNICS